MTIFRVALLLACLVFISQQAWAQSSPVAAPPAATTPAGATPSATIPAATTPAAVTAAPGAASTPTAPTACPAAFGFFGPANAPNASSSTTSGGSSTAQPSSVSVQQTNNAGNSGPAKEQKTPAPPTGIVKIAHLNPGLNATDVAAALQNKISGVTSIVPLGPSDLLYTIDPTKATGLPPLATKTTKKGKAIKQTPIQTPAQAVEAELLDLLGKIPPETITPKVLTLPEGYQGACSIITMIGHLVPNIASLAAISDTRILVGFTGGDKDVADATKTLNDLIAGLAISTVPRAPFVQSVTMRLYYDRDAASVASAVQSAFSQLKVTSVLMNTANIYSDTVVIADPTGSTSTSTLDQARRMIAQLDEPRAQIIVNAWSLQISSDKPGGVSEVDPQARRLASGYNDALESAVMRGWNYVNQTNMVANGATANAIDLDPLFSSYLCKSTTFGPVDSWTTQSLNSRCPFGYPVPQGTDSKQFHTEQLHYALGYSSIIGSEAPNLIQMLILVMATNHPGPVIDETVNRMEGLGESRGGSQPWTLTTGALRIGAESCQDTDKRLYRRVGEEFNSETADEGDSYVGTFIKNARKQIAPPYIGFACTREKLNELVRPGKIHEAYTTSAIGQFRAAVADYLFQNKMATEYPNDFKPFLYPAAAATLDAVLTPIVEAFNEDLEALQQNLQQQLTSNVSQDKHLHYTSNGLVSVKVVSGNQAMVQTQSLNYFPQNPTISLESFAQQIAAGQTPASTTAPAPVPLLAGSLSSVAATMAAYAATQPQQVTAKVGSGLALTVTPFTLSSAKGAELSVNVTYNENGAATISSDATQANSTDDLNSRVSGHQVNTLVRMDSLKFFEISTMQSVIARERKPWKPIDPFFELPLLDNPGIVIARRKPEVIYDQSIIFLEASITPTAADLGQGLIYQPDMVVAIPSGGGTSKRAEAHYKNDFGPWTCSEKDALEAISEYHKHMVAYFAGEYIDSDGAVHVPPVELLPDNLSQQACVHPT
jgi:hypothetical protein